MLRCSSKMGAPRRWINKLLGLKKSEKIASSEKENKPGSAGKINKSKPSVEPEKGRYGNESKENVETDFEDANWQWEMEHSGPPSTSHQEKNAARLSEDRPVQKYAAQQQPREDWREEWMGAYAKEGNFTSAPDSPNSPEEQTAGEQLEDDGTEGWATPDVRYMFEPDADPVSPHSSSPEVEDANFMSDLDASNFEEWANICMQNAVRGYVGQYETKTRQRMNEEWAAICIQAVYRGFRTRRAFRAVKGLTRLQALVNGHTLKRQTSIALRCIQALVKVQAHSRAKHAGSTLENQSVQKKLMQQLEVEAPAKKPGVLPYTQNGWCDKAGSAAEIRARWRKRQEAAAKREKARTYALARQWQAGIRQQPQQQQQKQQQHEKEQEATPTGVPTVKTEWGWKWLDRWMSVRPWEMDFFDDTSLRDGMKSPTSERFALVDAPTSRLTERKPLSSTGNGKPMPRFNITIEKSPSARRLATGLETPISPVSSRSPRTPVKNSAPSRPGLGSRSFSTPRERSSLSDFQDKKRLSLPGPMHGARLLAQTAVNSPRIQSPRTPQKLGGSRSNDVKSSKLSH
ncbi:protein IQ-DOMAIN 5-like isoform X1 [Salvia splendens]|uniref:protein IQ-DOMAIN 5-like isoform X1 n=2 Tax=Salvia splendens TaxID=180675 RepID=UPI001C278001|nr:protein IQ-DOMAIN 5-like isoform X1 [Salvia splendens]